jgi:hypothetical protein
MCFQVNFKPSHRYIERELESSAKTKAPLHSITHPSPTVGDLFSNAMNQEQGNIEIIKCYSPSSFEALFPSGYNGFRTKVMKVCNALNLGVEFFLLFSHQIQALLFPFSFFFSLSLDLFQKL